MKTHADPGTSANPDVCAGNTAQLWADYRRLVRHTRRRAGGTQVHDLRIGTRRLLARLELLRSLDPCADGRRARRRLKRLLAITSPARDARVQLRLFERLTPHDAAAGRRKFHRRLQQRDRRLSRELSRKLECRELGLHGLKPRRLVRPLAEAGGRLDAAWLRALRLAARRVLERQRDAHTGDADDRHRLRVALKKFRYLAEILPASGPDRLARLQRVQSSLGDLHDFELLLARLEKFAARHPATGRWLETRRRLLQRHGRALLRRQREVRFTATQLRAITHSSP